ncbi:MAG: SpoVA/SpoVAEb family sporulation membrane protein [Clostridiales bacterium]|nr:SpoVA/SpoVAEb family sporulation membrane protein [Clostridiales bacterium]
MNSKKEEARAYEAYVKEFTPKPRYFRNGFRAFLTGGLLCCAAAWFKGFLLKGGFDEKTAGMLTTIALILLAQVLTGLGWFDTIAKFAGAGCIVPITGFANSVVAPAIEYKKEGPVLGVGAKLFSLAGPVLVCGLAVSVVAGLIHWFRV